MTIHIGVVMDPIEAIKPYKDTTFAMLLAAQARGWELTYCLAGDLYLAGGRAFGSGRRVEVFDRPRSWFRYGDPWSGPLSELDAILMRKDPPVDMEYVYATYVLEQALAEGVAVVNHPRALRDTNEKLATAWFPQCTPPTLATRRIDLLRRFVIEQGDAVVKPLDGMGGLGVFRLTPGDPNLNVVLETLTHLGRRTIIAQRYLPEITEGDKRVLLVDGEPVPYALARIPPAGETRANLATGGRGVGVALSERERWIAAEVGPALRDRGLLFVGLDVIGSYLTEINVTSPTCVRELDAEYGTDIAGQVMDALHGRLAR